MYAHKHDERAHRGVLIGVQPLYCTWNSNDAAAREGMSPLCMVRALDWLPEVVSCLDQCRHHIPCGLISGVDDIGFVCRTLYSLEPKPLEKHTSGDPGDEAI